MDLLKTQIGTLNFAKAEKFIEESIASTLIAFAKSRGIEVSRDDAETFLKQNPPVPQRRVRKVTESGLAWQGFRRKFGDIWLASNKGKDLSDDEYRALVELALKSKTEYKLASNPKARLLRYKPKIKEESKDSDSSTDDDAPLLSVKKKVLPKKTVRRKPKTKQQRMKARQRAAERDSDATTPSDSSSSDDHIPLGTKKKVLKKKR